MTESETVQRHMETLSVILTSLLSFKMVGLELLCRAHWSPTASEALSAGPVLVLPAAGALLLFQRRGGLFLGDRGSWELLALLFGGCRGILCERSLPRLAVEDPATASPCFS